MASLKQTADGRTVRQRSLNLECLEVPLESKMPVAISPMVMRRLCQEDIFSKTMGSANLDRSWSLEEMRPRVSSMPNHMKRPMLKHLRSHGVVTDDHEESYSHVTHTETDLHKIRSFAITRKGLVKEGRKMPHQNGVSPTHPDPGLGPSHGACATGDDTPVETTESTERYTVLLLGAPGVGKRALVHEFLLPDSDPFMSFSSDDDEEHNISIMLDGRESTMEFVDMTDQEVAGLESLSGVDACVVVYSVEDRQSFEMAIDRLFELRQKDREHHLAKILVANKSDLVRTRVILPQEGRVAAESYDSKYIEVSVAIDHQVDELLVGILQQIRLNHQGAPFDAILGKKVSRKLCFPLSAIRRQKLFARLLGGRLGFLSKSCDNLYVL